MSYKLAPGSAQPADLNSAQRATLGAILDQNVDLVVREISVRIHYLRGEPPEQSASVRFLSHERRGVLLIDLEHDGAMLSATLAPPGWWEPLDA